MKIRYALALVSSFFLLTVTTARANLTALTNNTNIVGVSSIENWVTTGTTMNGMTVSVTTSNGLTTDASFSTVSLLGTLIGTASTAGWSLTVPNTNTYFKTTLWDIYNKSNYDISNITIKALTGNTIFDIISTSALTPGSEFGLPLSLPFNSTINNVDYSQFYNADSTITANAVFSDEVYLAGYNNNKPYGDIYGTLSINFIGLSAGKHYYVAVDTDNANPVPEPTTLILFGTGIFALSRRVVRRKK